MPAPRGGKQWRDGGSLVLMRDGGSLVLLKWQPTVALLLCQKQPCVHGHPWGCGNLQLQRGQGVSVQARAWIRVFPSSTRSHDGGTS